MGKLRIGLLTSTTISESKRRCLAPIMANGEYEIVHVFIDDRPGLSFKKKFKKNLKRGRGGYMLVMAWESFAKKGLPSKSISTQHFCERNDFGFSLWRTPIYSDNNMEFMASLNLDLLILLGGFGIVRDKIISKPKLGVLSYHHGDMRKYRGMPPALWEVYHGESEMGVTVQLLDSGLDSGIPIKEVTVPIFPKDNVEEAHARASEMGEPLLAAAVESLAQGHRFDGLKRFGRVYTLPNLRQYIILKWRILYRRLTTK